MSAQIPSNQQLKSDRSSVSSPGWPNSETVMTGLSIAVNVISEIKSFPISSTAVINAPIRMWRLATAFQKKDYLQIAFDVAAFTALFFPPYGRLFAIGIDLTSECLSAYHYWDSARSCEPPHFTRIDANVRENALRILNLTVEEAEKQETIEQHYKLLIDDLTRRRNKVSGSLLAEQIQYLIDDGHTAYKTLTV